MTERVVIVGGGQAGGIAAASLREQGYPGAITLIADEGRSALSASTVSKNYLAGQMSAAQVQLKPEKFYAENLAIEILSSARAESHRPPGSQR